jgi:hypothetical protein
MFRTGTTSGPLEVTLTGRPLNGGVAMTSSRVTWGQASGAVTGLQGSTIVAKVDEASGPVTLTMRLNLNQSGGTVTGTVSGTTGTTDGTGR